MIDEKHRLPVCALGAGAAHLVALALILPVMITLPGPSESMTSNRVAIPVNILAEAPPAMPMPAAPAVSSTQAPASPAQPRMSLAQPASDAIGALLENASAWTPATTTPEPEPSERSGDADDITGSLPEAALVDVVLPPRPTRVRRDADGNATWARRVVPRAKRVRRAAVSKRARAKPRLSAVAEPDVVPFRASWDGLLDKPGPIDRRTR